MRASRFRCARRFSWAACAVLGLAIAAPGFAQSPAQVAIRFFQAGGAYCFRLIPEGVALAEEREWTVMVLTSASNRKNTFRIRDVDPGATGVRGVALAAVGAAVTGVWRADADRAEFFDRFAAGIKAGVLRARVVKVRPGNLDLLATDRQRAEAYLRFSQRGSRVAFNGGDDLDAEALAPYAGYFPD